MCRNVIIACNFGPKNRFHHYRIIQILTNENAGYLGNDLPNSDYSKIHIHSSNWNWNLRCKSSSIDAFF